MKRKRPWLAALLNIIIFGLGYIYNGRRMLFGSLWTAAMVIVIAEALYLTFIGALPDTEPTTLSALATILVYTAFGYDAYQEAKSINKTQ